MKLCSVLLIVLLDRKILLRACTYASRLACFSQPFLKTSAEKILDRHNVAAFLDVIIHRGNVITKCETEKNISTVLRRL